MKIVSTLKGMWQVLRQAGAGFIRHKVLKLSASLAYYTIFSIGPMLLVVIFFADLFLGREAIEGTIYSQISGIVGKGAALQIQELIKNSALSGNTFTAVTGFVTLVIAATTVFVEMQDSINSIWNLKVRENAGWLKMLKTRLLSFSITASLAFLLLVSLLINALLDGFMHSLQKIFPDVAVIIIYVVNLLLTLAVVSLLFGIIYKVLPDAVLSWRDVIAGALFTGVLFMIGRFCISIYISKSNMGSTYGSAGSLVILLLWIYYSAVILYFGAEFTKAYAVNYGSIIRPNEYAVMIQMVKVESGAASVQDNEQHAKDTEKKD